MIPLPKGLLHSVRPSDRPHRYDLRPLQLGLGRQPWEVAVASILLCRTKRAQADEVLHRLLLQHPAPCILAKADTDALERIVQPCGLHRNRARALQRMSFRWTEAPWTDARELPGVGAYVADCIGLFCFGCTELECSDGVLHRYAETYRGPSLKHKDGYWWVEAGDVKLSQMTVDSPVAATLFANSWRRYKWAS